MKTNPIKLWPPITQGFKNSFYFITKKLSIFILFIFLSFTRSVLAETSSNIVHAHLTQVLPSAKSAKCVQIYYDHAPSMSDPSYYKGRLYAIALQNLLGHFPSIQQYIIPIELYQQGQLERCR